METIRIADFGTVITGKTPSSNNLEQFGEDYPFITPTDISEGRIVHTERSISEEGYIKFRRQILPPRSVCFVCIGATIGKICMTTAQSLTNQQINSVIVDTTRHDPFFVYYLLSTLAEEVKSVAGGAATPIVNKTTFENLQVDVPPLPVQRKIAAILSAYDDLIENNLRRIKILEEMAQNLYREWFVKFRFPGHQHTRFVDSPLGSIPEGWEVVPFTEIADVLSGGTPKTSVPEYWGGQIPFFAPKDAPNLFYITDTEKSITELGLKKCNSRLYPKDTVFITARGTVGKVVMPSENMAMNQSCYALKGKEGVSQLYLFLATKRQTEYLKRNTGGATFDTIVVDTFRLMKITKPHVDVIDLFSKNVQPLFELLLNAINKNRSLRSTRDLLLPKLISGEVDVSELDITVPEEVA